MMLAESPADSSDNYQPETLKLVYEATRDRLAMQSRDIDALNTKAIATLTSASLIATIPTSVRFLNVGSPTGASPSFFIPTFSTGLLIVAAGAFLLMLIAIYQAVRGREFRFPPDPAKLYAPIFLESDPDRVRERMIRDMSSAFVDNSVHVRQKSYAIDVAIILLFVESLALVIGFAVR